MMTTTQQIPIDNVRDLVMARNALRKNLVEQGINQPVIHARVSAVVTAMAELILTAGATGMLNVDVVECGEQTGIELDCRLSWLGGQLRSLSSIRQRQLNDTQCRLSRVTNDVECDLEDIEHPGLIARIWPA